MPTSRRPCCIGPVCRGNGELARALELMDEAVSCGLGSGMPTRAAYALVLQASIATSAGRADIAHAALERLRTQSIQATHGSQGLLQLVTGSTAWQAGHLDAALAHYAAAEPLLRPFRDYWFAFALELHAALAIEARRLDLATPLIEEIEAHPQYRRDRWLRGSALFLRAAMSHMQGARDDCRRLLLAAIETAPPGAVRAHACLGAVWLACEDGQPAQAAVWLREIEPWTREHPHGFAALARWRYASGDFAGAVAAQTACVERWPADPIGDAQRALLALYRRALDAGRVLPLEPLAALPTLRL
jgi:ATP/maltotriose-dependent transcriptional regulator MalT